MPPSETTTSPPNASRPILIVTLEGLATSALSCYGSSWNATPAIDAIAATGCVWDRWIASNDDPVAQFGRWIASANSRNSKHGKDSEGHDHWFAAADLVTDDPRLIGQQIGPGFERNWLVGDENVPRQPADEIDQTRFGELVAAAIERDAEGPWSTLWIHSRFLTECWDAPRALFPISEDERFDGPTDEVELLADPGTEDIAILETLPPLFDDVTPPQVELASDCHPDLVTSWMRTYGCQVRLVDLLIEVLLETLTVDDPLVMVAATSGISLGQNGWIGPQVGPLRSCDIRLPMVVSDIGPIRSPQVTSADRFAEVVDHATRHPHSLVTPEDWCRAEDEIQTRAVTESSRAETAVTTPRWQFVRDQLGDHLFLKPDDVEDANDVGRLRADVIEQIAGQPRE